MPRALPFLLLLSLASFGQERQSSQEPLAVAQRLFTDMAAHDGDHARSLFLPEAMLYSGKPGGTVDAMPIQQFLTRVSAGKGKWEERIWDPKIHEQGAIAIVWAPFEFRLNGRFSHCGIDSFSLLKVKGEWKIASVSDTRQTENCPSPPPR